MVEILEQATSFHYIAFVFLLAYFSVIMLGKKSYKKLLKYAAVITALCLVVYVAFLFLQRNKIRHSLQEMLTVADFTKEIDEKLANGTAPSDIIRGLKVKKGEVEDKAKELSLYDKVLGRSETIDTLLMRLNRRIDQEMFRVKNMSLQSRELYIPTSFEKTQNELSLISPVFKSPSYLNVGVVIDEEAAFKKENSLLVRIVRADNDSILYQQSYVPKSGANSFVLPNYFSDDMVQLQIGYINKNERKTYYYISCIPYGNE